MAREQPGGVRFSYGPQGGAVQHRTSEEVTHPRTRCEDLQRLDGGPRARVIVPPTQRCLGVEDVAVQPHVGIGEPVGSDPCLDQDCERALHIAASLGHECSPARR